jgi:MarR family transcriptional regulator, lower aerobic nicotinate degradation pathway regulator
MSPTRPSEDLGLPDALVQLSFAVHEILTSIAVDYDLSITQVRMLGILRDRELTMHELARFLTLEKSSVTGLIDRAERRGLVSRTRSDRDARAIHVRLTDHGRELAQPFAARVAQRISDLLAPLTARERAQLSKMATRAVGIYAEQRGIDLDAGRR